MTTTNIPRELPIRCEHEREIMEWMLSRPEHDLDGCVLRGWRWKYEITDHGLFSHVTVTDMVNGDSFTPKVDIDNL